MNMVHVSSAAEFDHLAPNKWGIREPSLEFSDFDGVPDLIVMPGAAFDRSRNRLGYGKGYYDKYLERMFQKAKEQNIKPPATGTF